LSTKTVFTIRLVHFRTPEWVNSEDYVVHSGNAV
jgi:hypothetical protein